MQLYLATGGFQSELLKLNVQLQLVSERKSEHAKLLLHDRNQAIEIWFFFSKPFKIGRITSVVEFVDLEFQEVEEYHQWGLGFGISMKVQMKFSTQQNFWKQV